MFLDSPDAPHVRVFDKWYHIGLRPVNKLQKFHKDQLAIQPPMELEHVKIQSKMWWFCLNQVATPLNTMVRSIYDKSKKVINAIDKQTALLSYLTGDKIPFNSTWSDVDHVLIPIFMDKKAHWILGYFDIANWHINVYNSSFKTIRDVAVLDAVEPLQNVIPQLLCCLNIL
ncbi:Ulp1 protease family [Abeliophyllum distichum]|uniref:Ulp1 protease family n=1 Tax=Abeliophyllum distichum TaxID=126358 RepID=A0ABD1UPY1_9LAMI